jgi:hypothetical protein
MLELHSSRRAVALRLFSKTPIVLLSSSCCLLDFGAAAVYRHRRPCCPLLGCLDPKPEPVLPTAPQVASRPGAPGAKHRRRVVAALQHGARRQLRGHRGGGRQAAGHLHDRRPRPAHQRRPPGAVLGSYWGLQARLHPSRSAHDTWYAWGDLRQQRCWPASAALLVHRCIVIGWHSPEQQTLYKALTSCS